MLHLLIGEDDYSIRQALGEIKKGIGDATALMTNTAIIDGKQATAAELAAACETVPFLSEKRLVIVEGLLERFDPAGKRGKKKPAKQAEAGEEHKLFAEAIKRLPPFTELVVISATANERNPLYHELATMTKVRVFPLLKDAQLRQWVSKRVTEGKSSISQQAAALLVKLVGNDLWTMVNETDKLILFTSGRRIEEKDVMAIVSPAQEANIFEMVDAILESRIERALELLQKHFNQGAAPAQLLTMLARQVRIVLQVKDMKDRGRPRSEIQVKLGLNSSFIFEKAWGQAGRYSLTRISDVYHKLLDTDIAIKTGKLDGEIALNILVAELGQQGTVSA